MTLIDKDDAKAFVFGFVMCYIMSIGGYIYLHGFDKIMVVVFFTILPSVGAGLMVMILRLMNEHGKTLV